MAEIKIRNIGPVKQVDLTLKKINVFMGPQSSGKSTIAKIISHCTWVEKDVATSQSLDAYNENRNYFKEQLEKYHRLKGYFKSDSYIFYKSNVVQIEYVNGEFSIGWIDKYAYKRSKISYIPSERNLIILPEMKKVEFGDTNIRSFLFDWFDARKNYSKEAKMPILELGTEYYYNENSEEDRIIGNQSDDSYDILLPNASSGLQSITPLLITIDYLTNWLYDQNESISSLSNERKNRVNQMLIEELILQKYFKDNHDTRKWNDEINEINEKLKTNDVKVRPLYANWREIEKLLFSTQNSQFIIEEPEQNLFPETQRNLVYHLLEKYVNSEKEHRLTITTHSPYILYALNNCMLGGLVNNKISTSDKEKLKCKTAFIDPKNVSINEIHDGILKPIQQDDGLISSNYFDKKMKELMDDFYVMLNYYGS